MSAQRTHESRPFPPESKPAQGEDPVREANLLLESPAATRAAGLALGARLPPRAVVLLEGGMGAGKTTLVKAVCEGAGIDPRVVISPTYTLVNVYPGAEGGKAGRPVFHVDLFRLESPEPLLELDRDDWINPDGPTLIEWADLARPFLAGEMVLEIELAMVEGREEARRMTARGDGGAFGAIFAAWEAPIPPPPGRDGGNKGARPE